VGVAMRGVSGSVAVVTGGGSGIGRAIAMALANEGAAVAVADIVEAKAVAVVAEITAAGGRAIALDCDVSERASVRAMQAEVVRRLGPTSLLIANAGVTMFERLTDMSDADIDWIIQVNLLGVINCLQAFLPDMIERREGHVLATSSSSALLSPFSTRHAVYAAAKAGVLGLMMAMRCQLKEFGIGVSTLCPGLVPSQILDSPRYRPARFGKARNDCVAPPAPTGNQRRALPRPAEEVAQMVLHAIRENRAVVVTDANQREMFENGFVELVSSAFDDIAEFDAANHSHAVPQSRDKQVNINRGTPE
jgi:NAD(P)-dependent dehydrogenase (short-subunit alcohol dehydrogenase family)